MTKANQRKFSLKRLLSGRKTRGDESQWFILEAEVKSGPRPRRRRKKRKGWVLGLLTLACLSVSVPLGLRWANEEIFYKNEEFFLKRLSIQTDGTLDEVTIAGVANVTAGVSLMDLDLEAICRRIETLPNVEKASVTRELPDRLNIQVTERIPVAWLSCPPMGIRPGDKERGFLLDANAYLFQCAEVTEELKQLPSIEAYKMAKPEVGTLLEASGVENALHLVAENARIFEEQGPALRQVRLRNEWSVECLYHEGFTVTFDRHEIDRGMKDLVVILDNIKDLEPRLTSVNVAVRENIPIVFDGPLATAPQVDAGDTDSSADAGAVDSAEDREKMHLRSILKGG